MYFVVGVSLVLLVGIAESALARSWVKFGEANDGAQILEIDKTSLKKYQGMIVFTTRERSKKADKPMVVFRRLFTVCRSRETWDVASRFVWEETYIPKFEMQAGIAGPTIERLNNALSTNTFILEGCKRPNSRDVDEIPVSEGKERLYVLLPEETKVSGDRVSAWVKVYRLKVEPVLEPDGNQVVFNDKQVTETIVVKDSHVLINWVSDCRRDENAVASLYDYDAQGNVTSSTVVPSEKLSFAPTLPGSVGRTVHGLMCQLR